MNPLSLKKRKRKEKEARFGQKTAKNGRKKTGKDYEKRKRSDFVVPLISISYPEKPYFTGVFGVSF